MKSLFKPMEVAKLIGISYRQIQYWDKTGFIKPSYRQNGKYRRYTFSDLVQMKIAKNLRERSYSIQRLRTMIKSLRGILSQVSDPFRDLTFLIEGDRILVFNGDVLINPASDATRVAFRVQDLREEILALFPDEEGEEYEDDLQAVG